MLKRVSAGCAAVMAMIGCAGPVAVYPELSSLQVESERIKVQKEIIERYLTQQDRVDRIAWPVLRENTSLCRKFTKASYGLKFGNAGILKDRIDGLTLKQIKEAGFSEAPFVMNVPETGPAGRAGIKRGMQIVSVDGVLLKQDIDILRKTLEARELAHEDFGDLPPMKLEVSDGETVKEVAISAERVCASEIFVANTNDVNATAGTENITIFVGLLDRMADDNNVAMVIGHELAHIAGNHVRKTVANSTRSGYVLWGVPLQAGASFVDLVIGAPIEAISGVETDPGGALVTRLNNSILRTQDFEREADYVGLYMASRAGYDISDAEETFRLLSQIRPSSTYGERSHPTTPERIASIATTRLEIAEKRSKGERIVPYGWPVFKDENPDAYQEAVDASEN